MNKAITVEQIKKAFKLCERVGIKTTAFFMIGMLDETKQDIQKTIKLVKRINPDWTGVSITAPLPKTKLADMAYRRGLIPKHLLEEDMSFGWGTDSEKKSQIVLAKDMTRKELECEYQRFERFVRERNLAKSFALIKKDIRKNFLNFPRYIAYFSRKFWKDPSLMLKGTKFMLRSYFKSGFGAMSKMTPHVTEVTGLQNGLGKPGHDA
jgi:radical SAM superfamily enzyme YgiQ (UPF0313 family)